MAITPVQPNESQRFFRPEITVVLWCAAIANTSAPTFAELDAGTDLSSEVADWAGWTVESAFIDTPDLAHKYVSQISGRQNAPASNITFYLDLEGDDLRDLLVRGTRGFIVIADTGLASGKGDVFPVEIGSVSKARDLDKAAQFTVSFAITREPKEDVVLPQVAP